MGFMWFDFGSAVVAVFPSGGGGGSRFPFSICVAGRGLGGVLGS